MPTVQIQNLENRVSQLERLMRAFIKQEKEEDWLENPTIVQRLDQIAENEASMSEKELDILIA